MNRLARDQSAQALCCFGSLMVLMVLVLSGCSKLRTEAAFSAPPSVRASFDFRKGTLGWEADFSDYSIAQGGLQLESGLRRLPGELKSDATGFYIQGNNSLGGLFMFLKRRLGPREGIRNKQAYLANFRVLFASNAASKCPGAGESPGESVFLKAGASSERPVAILKSGNYRMSIDKGELSAGGKDASPVGNIANGLLCKDFPSPLHVPYVSLERIHRHPFPVKANSNGELWLLVGTDSGYDSITGLYFQQIDVELTPVKDDLLPTSRAQ